MSVVAPPGRSTLRAFLAAELRARRTGIVQQWLDAISDRVAIDDNEVFPTEDLLNHVPILIDGIATFLEAPENQLDTASPVTAKAMELGALRHSQGFDAYQILKEHEMLVRIILAELREPAETRSSAPGEILDCWEEIAQAVELIRQATVTHFLRVAGERVNEREERLRRFNRMVAHELKNRVGALRGAAHMLEEDWLGENERKRFQTMIVENSQGLQHVLANLEALSRLDSDARQSRNVLLPQAAAESVRQLAEAAAARQVTIVIAESLPPVEVDAAAAELCIANLVSNAIKYSDPSKKERRVEISGQLRYPSAGDGELIVRVSDNGIGISPQARPELFRRFYRAHSETVTDAEGTGLGLSIVRETAESLGGSAWAEFPEDGSTIFAFSFPSRREEDAAAAGIRRPGSPPAVELG